MGRYERALKEITEAAPLDDAAAWVMERYPDFCGLDRAKLVNEHDRMEHLVERAPAKKSKGKVRKTETPTAAVEEAEEL